MAKYSIEDTTLISIADAIREKNGATDTYKPGEMAAAIQAISAGGTEVKFRTADEIYEQDRPKDWPVLPTPAEGETYFLCKTLEIGKVYARVGTVGYIDESGNYVSVAKTTGSYIGSYGYWNEEDVSSSWDSRMDKYFVFKSTGFSSDYTCEQYSSNSSAPTNYTQYVLEIKTGLTDPMFGSIVKHNASTAYSGRSDFRSVRFISFYGPQDWQYADYKFDGFNSLKCLRFDSDENNAFLRANGMITTAAHMFYECYSYEAEIQLTPAWSALTTITSLCYGCKRLSRLILDCPYVTSYSYVLYSADSVKEMYVNLPSATASNTYLTYTTTKVDKITKLNISGITASAQNITSYGISYAKETHNLLINKSGVSSWTMPCTTNAERYTFDPEQKAENLPTTLSIQHLNMSREALIEFFNSLPDATGLEKTISFGSSNSFYISDDIEEELLAILLGKGYTVTY